VALDWASTKEAVMPSDDVQALRGAYDAFARQDMPNVFAAMTDDIDWVSPDSTPIGGRFRGHDEVMGFFGRLPEHFLELAVEPVEFLDAGDTIVVLVRIRGRGRNGSFDLDAVHVWRMRGGKAAAFAEYIDTARLLEAIGQPAAARA
jgi:ketosteroid isomerase-like protein